MALEAADEVAHLAQRDAFLGIETLGLHIDDIEAEGVLIDHAVDAAVSDPAERAAGFAPSAAVAHLDQEIDDQPLEEGRREGMHPADDLPGKVGIQQLEARGDGFLGVFRRRIAREPAVRSVLGAPRGELGISLEHADVDLG